MRERDREIEGKRAGGNVVFQRSSQHVNMDFIAAFRIGPHRSSLSTMGSRGPHTHFIYCSVSFKSIALNNWVHVLDSVTVYNH